MDTVDRRKSEEWLNNLVKELDKKEPNYLVIIHRTLPELQHWCYS